VTERVADCENAGLSNKRRRIYCRKFNYQEARDRYAAGETIEAIARDFGVTGNTVRRVVSPEYAARLQETSRRYTMSGVCPDCGKPGTVKRRGVSSRCAECGYAAQRTSVRVDEQGEVTEIRCGTCKTWKPPEDYSPCRRKLVIRSHGNRICRDCDTAHRKAYRERNKVPCVRCGKPSFSEKERKRYNRHTTPTGLCLACYRDSLRKPSHPELT
jgi:Zn ribbon nucleic-acid-binding protein